MGALPKRRISTGRKGRRRQDKKITVTSVRLTRTTSRQRRAQKQGKEATE